MGEPIMSPDEALEIIKQFEWMAQYHNCTDVGIFVVAHSDELFGALDVAKAALEEKCHE